MKEGNVLPPSPLLSGLPRAHCPLGLARFGAGRTCWACPELPHPPTSGPMKGLGQWACPDWFSVSSAWPGTSILAWSGVTVPPVLGGRQDRGWVARSAGRTQAVWLDVNFRGRQTAAWLESAQFTPQGCPACWSADPTAPCWPVSPHLGRPGGLPRSEPPPCGQSPPGGPGPLLAASPACPARSRVQLPATGGFNWRTGPPSLGRRRGVSRLTVLLPIADSPSMATSTLTPSVSFPEGSRAWLSRVGDLAVRTARPASQAPATCWPAATCPPESPQAPLSCGHRGRQAPEERGCGPLGRV